MTPPEDDVRIRREGQFYIETRMLIDEVGKFLAYTSGISFEIGFIVAEDNAKNRPPRERKREE